MLIFLPGAREGSDYAVEDGRQRPPLAADRRGEHRRETDRGVHPHRVARPQLYRRRVHARARVRAARPAPRVARG